jgi:hypothetical protein
MDKPIPWPICHPGQPWRGDPKQAVHPYVQRVGPFTAGRADYVCLGCGQTLGVAVKFVA